jgi:hypothetical protein
MHMPTGFRGFGSGFGLAIVRLAIMVLARSKGTPRVNSAFMLASLGRVRQNVYHNLVY